GCVVRSFAVTFNPWAVAAGMGSSAAAEFMNRGWALVETNGASGLGDPGGKGIPSFWMKAKFTYSIAPPQALLTAPLFMFSDRLSMLSAAHHWVVSQLSNQPGGYNCISTNPVPGCLPM